VALWRFERRESEAEVNAYLAALAGRPVNFDAPPEELSGEHYRTLCRHHAPERVRPLTHKPAEKPVAAPGELTYRSDAVPQRAQRRVG
jgi:hypothetical protein